MIYRLNAYYAAADVLCCSVTHKLPLPSSPSTYFAYLSTTYLPLSERRKKERQERELMDIVQYGDLDEAELMQYVKTQTLQSSRESKLGNQLKESTVRRIILIVYRYWVMDTTRYYPILTTEPNLTNPTSLIQSNSLVESHVISILRCLSHPHHHPLLCTISMFFIVPLLIYYPTDYGPDRATQLLFNVISNPSLPNLGKHAAVSSFITNLNSVYGANSLLYLDIHPSVSTPSSSAPLVNNVDLLATIRPYMQITLEHSRYDTTGATLLYHTKAIISYQAYYQRSSLLTIFLYVFIATVLAGGFWAITDDVQRLVLAPIERMMNMVDEGKTLNTPYQHTHSVTINTVPPPSQPLPSPPPIHPSFFYPIPLPSPST